MEVVSNESRSALVEDSRTYSVIEWEYFWDRGNWRGCFMKS